MRMDWGGAVLLLGSTVCLLLALQVSQLSRSFASFKSTDILSTLQRGGISDPWGSSTIIGLLVGFVVIFAVFLAFETWLGDRSSISMRLLRSRNLGVLALGPQFACGVTFYSLICESSGLLCRGDGS